MTQGKRTRGFAAWVGRVLCSLLLCGAPASAHLIAAQKGTLNLVGDAAFLVLSVPVSAFRGVDDDGDGALSRAELQTHAPSIRAQLQSGVQLLGPDGAMPMQLVMVDIALPDAPPNPTPPLAGEPTRGPTADPVPFPAPETAARHLTILGRFTLRPSGTLVGAGDAPQAGGLSMRFTLFGAQADEQLQDLTITRQHETQWLRFTPRATSHALLPGSWTVLAEYVRTGARHVLGGADHLLFLLVVLAGGWSGRALLAVLTCFTAGHAISLGACLGAGWVVPARFVEPAIAATLVGMAAFDAGCRWRDRPARLELRLALVFACALVHGLGLADALSDLTQWPLGSSPMLWALAGFNLGVESAQVAVAAVAGGAWWLARRLTGPDLQRRVRQLITLGVTAAGAYWLVERLLQ